MKVLMINVVCGIRSTGRICTDLAMALINQGHEVKIAYGREYVPEQFKKYAVRIGSEIDIKLHGLKVRLFDRMGFGSKKATLKFIEWVKEYNPDVIHLHNLHGYYINVEILFDYLKKSGKKIIWTLHDCWSFTGHCAHFDYIQCDKWKTICKRCPIKKEYPKRMFIDNSQKNYIQKKELFTGIKNLMIVTPSEWLSNIVKSSFLKEYNIKVIHNGIDTNNFKPVISNIKKKYNCNDKKLILGVSSVWNEKKGIDTIYELAKRLESENYQMIIVGVNKKQKKKLPHNVIAIERTNNIKLLAELYSAADIFINPTLEDTYPTINLEALSCGTPVISYDTGGSGESIMWGYVVEKNNIDEMEYRIRHFDVVKKSNMICNFDIIDMVNSYMELYINNNK